MSLSLPPVARSARQMQPERFAFDPRPSMSSPQFEGWWRFGKKEALPQQGQTTPAAEDGLPPAPGKSQGFNPQKSRFVRATMLNAERIGRYIGARLYARKLKEFVTNANQLLDQFPPNTPEGIRAKLLVSETLFTPRLKEIEMNFESPQFQDLTRSNEACLFIVNHDYQVEDPAMLAMFNTGLYEGYIENGLAATCPDSKVILNQDILDTMSSDGLRAVYEKLGAVPVDASVSSEGLDTYKQTFMEWLTHLIPKRWRVKRPVGGDGRPVPVVIPKKSNGRVLMPILKAFNENKSHIFLFPEGRHAGRTDELMTTLLNRDLQGAGLPLLDKIDGDPVALEKGLKLLKMLCPDFDARAVADGMTMEDAFGQFVLKDRFQTGVINMILQALKRKDQVKVVPLGFALYDQAVDSKKPLALAKLGLTPETASKVPEERLGSVYVGKPMVFKKGTDGQISVTPGNLKEAEALPRLKRQFALTEEGESRSFTGMNIVPIESQVFDVVCENLRVSKMKAKKQLVQTLADSLANPAPAAETPLPAKPTK